MKRVVVFGAGLVVRAHVRYLLDHGFQVTVASRTVSKAEDILDGHANGTPMAFDITVEPEKLESRALQRDSIREIVGIRKVRQVIVVPQRLASAVDPPAEDSPSSDRRPPR